MSTRIRTVEITAEMEHLAAPRGADAYDRDIEITMTVDSPVDQTAAKKIIEAIYPGRTAQIDSIRIEEMGHG